MLNSMAERLLLTWPAASLLPGSLVNVRVKAVLSDGLQVSFLTYFTGTVDPFHLGQVPPRHRSATR